MIAFHFYLKQGSRYTISTVLLTALITIAFIGRNTSIVGWIPLLAIKVLREGALPAFLLSAITVAIPCMAVMVYIDTVYYGGDEWVMTSLNFLKVNVLENLSQYFGVDPWYRYVLDYNPNIFTILFPFVLYANSVGHVTTAWSKN